MGRTLRSNDRSMSQGKASNAITDGPIRIKAGRLTVRRRSSQASGSSVTTTAR